jgi:hypothetical protein
VLGSNIKLDAKDECCWNVKWAPLVQDYTGARGGGGAMTGG